MHWLLVGYMFLFIHRPFEFWPALGEMHIERVYMAGVFLVWCLSPKQWLPNLHHAAYAVFAFAVLFCWGMSPWMDKGQQVVEDWFKIVVFYILFVSVVNDEKKLRQIVLGFVLVMSVYMAHSFKEYLAGRHTYRMGIARMIGVDTTQGDPNSFGASIVFALPFASLFWKTSRSTLIRTGVIFYYCLSIGCILLTGSRSSLLGLLVFAAIALWRSSCRWTGLALAFGCAPLVFVALPDELQTRFETIVNPEVGPENAKVSGEGRLEGLVKGFDLLLEYPATGCGPGAWRPATHSKLESHNLFGQLMGEMGLAGLGGFSLILGCYWLNLRAMKQARAARPDRASDFPFQLAGAIGMGIFLMLFEGNFGHNLFRHNWLWYGGFLIVARQCVEVRSAPAAYVYSARVRYAAPALTGRLA
jgi:hypothetical protein